MNNMLMMTSEHQNKFANDSVASEFREKSLLRSLPKNKGVILLNFIKFIQEPNKLRIKDAPSAVTMSLIYRPLWGHNGFLLK